MIEHEEHRSPGICILVLQIMVLAAVLILGHACLETPVTFAKDSSSVSVETDAARVSEDSRDQASEKHDDAAVRQQRRPEENQAQLQKAEEPNQIKQHLSEEETSNARSDSAPGSRIRRQVAGGIYFFQALELPVAAEKGVDRICPGCG